MARAPAVRLVLKRLQVEPHVDVEADAVQLVPTVSELVEQLHDSAARMVYGHVMTN